MTINGQTVKVPTSDISPDDIKIGLLMHFDCDCLNFLGDRYRIMEDFGDGTYSMRLYCHGKPYMNSTINQKIKKEEILSKWFKTDETLEEWVIRLDKKRK